MSAAYRHTIPVRYAEVDMQQVVFNAHYLAYVDDAMSAWMRATGLQYTAEGTYGDTLQIDCSVVRWGNTSFDVRFDIKVREETIVEIVLTYVGVVPGTTTTMAVPEPFQSALSGATTS